MRKFPKFHDPVVPTTMHAELIKLLQERGISENDVLAGTGVRPGMLGSPEARMSFLQAAIIADNSLKLSGDPALGLEFGRHIHINGIGVLGLAAMSSRNLEEANRCLLRNYPLLASNLRIEYEVRDGIMSLRLHPTMPMGQLEAFTMEIAVACLYELSIFVVGKPLPYVGIDFAYPEPAHAARYREVFDCPVSFDAPTTALRMEARALSWPLRYASEASAKFAEQQCQALMLAHQSENAVEQVAQHLRSRIEAPPSLTELARELQTSERSLRRALGELNSSYRALLDEARRDRAIELLITTEMGIEHIAERLGFATGRSFRRAFIRWTGKPPTAIRSQRSDS